MRIWGTPVLRELGQSPPDCTKCRRPEQTNSRVLWGCDEPSQHVSFEIGCSNCDGGDPDCETCAGGGVAQFFRCPASMIRDFAAVGDSPAWLDALIRAYIQYDTRNVMPLDGGYIDQSAGFGRGVDIIDAERGRYAEMQQKKAQREQKLAKMKQQSGGQAGGRGRRR